MTRLAWGSVSETGRVRANNQDAALADARLCAVADGMGGHVAGELASHLALDAFRAAVTDTSLETLVEAVRAANRAVYERAVAEPELRGMGTTLCALALVETDGFEKIGVVNVGDSRVYVLQGEEFLQISEDHSLVEAMVREGQLSAEEARLHPQRNILTRALGIDDDVDVDSWEVAPYPGDRYLLCSDGLFNEVEEAVIASTLRRLADPTDAAGELVRLANDGGGRDNITCVVVDVVDDAGADAEGDGSAATTATPAVDAGVGSSAPAPPGLARASGPAVALAERPEAMLPPPPRPRRDDPEPLGGPAPRPKRFTWRVVAFALVFLGILAAGAYGTAWYARDGYFVRFQGDDVAIFKGRPEGVLWFDPTLEETTSLTRDEVLPAEVAPLETGVEQDSVAAARTFVDNLEREYQRAVRNRSSQVTTTTSPPPTTTTAPAATSAPPPPVPTTVVPPP